MFIPICPTSPGPSFPRWQQFVVGVCSFTSDVSTYLPQEYEKEGKKKAEGEMKKTLTAVREDVSIRETAQKIDRGFERCEPCHQLELCERRLILETIEIKKRKSAILTDSFSSK